VIYLEFLIGLLLGYVIGWHRGALGMPFGARRWMGRRKTEPKSVDPRKEAPNIPKGTDAIDSYVEDKRPKIESDLTHQYPDLTREQVGIAASEIMERGKQFLAKL